MARITDEINALAQAMVDNGLSEMLVRRILQSVEDSENTFVMTARSDQHEAEIIAGLMGGEAAGWFKDVNGLRFRLTDAGRKKWRELELRNWPQ